MSGELIEKNEEEFRRSEFKTKAGRSGQPPVDLGGLLNQFRGRRASFWIVCGVILFIIIYLWFGLYKVGPGKVGIIFAKFGNAPASPSRVIVEKGEKGRWREPLLPGMYFFWALEPLWNYNIEIKDMTKIDANHIGTVKALDGEPLQPGQILAKDDYIDKDGRFHMGQRGPRLEILSPGLYPINPYYLEVKSEPAVIIPEGKIGVATKRIGQEPPTGTVLVAKADNFRGIQREIMPPGLYYLNPWAVKVDLVDAVVIKGGEVGVVTKKVGKLPPMGTILVEAADEYQGIQREILQPGIYYVNPYEKEVKIAPAVKVPDGHVGVQIAKTGAAKPADQLLAKYGQRGILAETMPPGLYYLNPYEFEAIAFDTRQQRYEMTRVHDQGDTTGDDSITFLSDDGFVINFDLTVIYQILPNDAPYVVATIGRDVKTVREVIIRPAARSYARIYGSKQKGEEFVHGETREKFMENLQKAIQVQGQEYRVRIHQAQVQHFEVPIEIRDPITRKVIAKKLEEQYIQQQSTEQANAELARRKEQVIFESEKVKSETAKVKATIDAERHREVEQINMAMKEYQAKGDAAKVKIDAEAKLFAQQKEAEGTLAKKLAEAEGQKRMVDAWAGEGAYSLVAFELAKRLEGATILPLETFFGGGQAGDGTIRYQDNLGMLNFLKIDELIKKQYGTKGDAAKPEAPKPAEKKPR